MKKIIIGVVSILLISAFLISTILLILEINQITKSVSNTVVSNVIRESDEQLKIYENSNRKEILINNSNFGNELFQKIKLKNLQRVSREEGMETLKNTTYYLEYSSGKECFYIVEDGRIFVIKDKSDIRNISVLHWLWWKIDNIKDNYTAIYYLSQPDESIIDYLNAETN